MNYVSWEEFQARSQWYESQSFYGNAYQISRNIILASIAIICIITPFTNWFIPIASKIIKTGITLRWG